MCRRQPCGCIAKNGILTANLVTSSDFVRTPSLAPQNVEMITDLPFSPSAERNKTPIWEVLRQHLAGDAAVLEFASGTGQHAQHFVTQSAALGWRWHWQPTEADPNALAVIDARGVGLPGMQPARAVDVCEVAAWPVSPDAKGWHAIFVSNLLHISPVACSAGLMQGAARSLRPGGRLFIYGPFVIPGVETAPSNLAFDADLRRRNPTWGLRSLADVQAWAVQVGLQWEARCELPANNGVLIFRR